MLKNTCKYSFFPLALSLMSFELSAAGFAVQEQSITGLGRAFAGSAAVADDASTIFFNPAGLTYLSKDQINIGFHVIEPKGEFKNQNSSAPFGALSGSNADAAETAVVPNFYYAQRINNKVVAGIGINAPFGLVTEYDDDWVGRYHAIRSDLKTVNFNPSLAYKANDKLSIGFGINLQYAELQLTQAVDFGAACAQTATSTNPLIPAALKAVAATCAVPEGFDGKAETNAKDWSWGYNVGIIYQFNQATRAGIHFRSKISQRLEGDGKFTIPDNAAVQTLADSLGFNDGALYGSASLPESLSVALHHKINKKWSLSTDASWTRWNRYQFLTINSSVDRLNTSKPAKWNNIMRYAIGTDYQYSDKWQLRAGFAYEETPVPSSELRSARIPDNDRKWFSVGASYKLNEQFIIDSAYTFIDPSTPKLNETDDRGYTLTGEYNGNVHIFAMQLRWLL